MRLKTIDWVNNQVRIIDQTKLPGQLRYLHIRNLKEMYKAIKEMKIRGAPVLAAAAAFGVILGMRNSWARDYSEFKKELDEVVQYIGSSRPTAVNLFWGLKRMLKITCLNQRKPINEIKKILLKEAKAIIKEDMVVCRKMAKFGAKMIKQNDKILTLCNAGILATIDYGTALGVIYRAKEEGKDIKVFACETRPLLQGARLTTWELKKNGIDVTLICDNMAASIMKQKKIDKVIVGADRVAANGDVANKIGTYNMAVLAKYHKIPFYVAAPLSSFDLKIREGPDIPIEQRERREVTELFFKKPTAPRDVKVINPAFDITPNCLITAIITEKGIIKPPFRKNILALFKNINVF